MSRETDPLVLDIPDSLRHLPLWFNWRWAERVDNGTKKRFKLPCQVTGRAASSIDRNTWTTYDKAAEASSQFDGLAIGFGHWGEPPDDYCIAGIDLDGCLAEGGGLKDWAAEILGRVDSYAEFSPSGKGIHILVKVGPDYLPGIKINLSETEHVEFYSTARYFTFTGNRVPGTPDDLQPRRAVYEALRAEYEARRPSSARTRAAQSATKPATAGKADERRVILTNAEIVEKAQSGPSGEAFERLWNGDMADYREDHSAADMALAGRLAFWTGKDPEQMDLLFRSSGLFRPKWDTRRGLSTYGEQTIEVAIANCEEIYSGGDRSSESFVEKLKAKRAAKVAATQVLGDTVKAGHVREHTRGEDKPDRVKPIAEASANQVSPMRPDETLTPLGRVVRAPSQGVEVAADLFSSAEAARVTNEAVATVEVQQGHMDGPKAGRPSPAASPQQADLFHSNGAFTHDLALDTLEVDAAELERMRQKLLADLPVSEQPVPSKASEYVAQSDVDYTVVEDVEVYAELEPHEVTDPDEHALTDDGNFMRFRDRYAGQLIFTKSNGWMRFDDRLWVKGDQYAVRAAQQVARDMVALSIIDPRLPTERKTALAKHGIASQSAGRIHAMANLASANDPFTREEINLDRDQMLLNTPSGIINLRDGTVMPHDPARYMTKITSVEYDPDAHSDLWDEVLREATVGKPGLAEFLCRAAGYTLTGVTSEDAVFFLHGGGGTAKSTIGESIKAMMGSYAASMRSEALTAAGNSGHSDDIARLVGARMVITGEADKADKMRDGLFKRLSGGETIDASRKGKSGFNFVPRFKMWFITNTVPALNPDDSGIWRRVYKLPFDIKVPNPDRRIRIALINDPVHQKAILAWAVRGAVEWRKDGLGVPLVVKEATEMLRRSMDGLADFFDQCCYFNQDPHARLYSSAKDLMEAYTRWANDEGIDGRFHASARRLGQGAMARGARDRRTTRERGYLGVIIKSGAEIDTL